MHLLFLYLLIYRKPHPWQRFAYSMLLHHSATLPYTVSLKFLTSLSFQLPLLMPR